MSDVRMSKLTTLKKESRQITKTILEYGVTEDQKIDIMFNMAITLENNEAMKEITAVLKKFRETINKTENIENNSVKKKILL
jgi:hypothetical protein